MKYGDLISRQAAIDALMEMVYLVDGHYFENVEVIDKYDAIETITALPSAQPDFDEWCTDCKEYDKEKHCCSRFNRVIREALKDAQLEPCGEMVSREVVVKFFDDWMSALDINCHHQSVADLRIIKGDIKNLPSAQPEQYTKEELKIFLHGLSLRLLSLRSAQYWGYSDKTAKEIEFLAHLYEKVEADVKGKA